MTDAKKKLFTCSLEIEMVVLATTEEDARKIARASLGLEVSNYDATDFDCSPTEQALPFGWDRESVPYGADDTIEELRAAESKS
jgi:vacuolar-type H+-ATPase subunit I/STV1